MLLYYSEIIYLILYMLASSIRKNLRAAIKVVILSTLLLFGVVNVVLSKLTFSLNNNHDLADESDLKFYTKIAHADVASTNTNDCGDSNGSNDSSSTDGGSCGNAPGDTAPDGSPSW